ncbi:MAG: hypothetical protein JXA42_24640 [Anaerolineales bacterium]|nr:hypothetical protein [Anaerolineales bacterium]
MEDINIYNPKEPKGQEISRRESSIIGVPDIQNADPNLQLIPSGGRTAEADASFLKDNRLSPVQRQQMAEHIGKLGGNRHLQRVIALAEAPKKKARTSSVQRKTTWAEIREGYDADNEGTEQDEQKEEEPLEIHEENVEEKSKLAARIALRIKNAIVPRYQAMLNDPKGFKAIEIAGALEKALGWAFNLEDTYANEYLGFKYQPLLLRYIHQIPGLYNKLQVLVGMEPYHARAVRNYLDIEPPTTFDYDMTMQGVGGGEYAEAVALGIDITCKEGDTKLWHAMYAFGGAGIGVSAVPVTASIGSASFETTEFWNARDFEGGFSFRTASAGFIGGIGLGDAKITGSGEKDPIDVDLSGFTWMSPNLAAGEYRGYLKLATGVKYASPSAGVPKMPEINVIKDADESDMVVFEANSGTFPGFGDIKFGSLLTNIIKRGNYKLTISGSSSYENEYNQQLLDARLLEVRRAIAMQAMMQGALETINLPDDKVKIERTVVPKLSETEKDDPAMDRAIVIQITGAMSEKLD